MTARAMSKVGWRAAAFALRLYGVDAARVVVLRVALALAALVTMLYSAPLWRAHALPPQVPPLGLAPPARLDAPLLLVTLAALLALLRGGRWTAPAALTFVGAVFVLVLGDQSRWQPEVQMFVLFALGLALAAVRVRARVEALTLLRLYVISLYAYSGLQKLNDAFTHGTSRWLVEPIPGLAQLERAAVAHDLWTPFAVAMALTETSLALLLVLPRTRRTGVLLAAGMHLLLLWVLGPFGHNYNAVVWPWNVFMLVAVPALFWGFAGWPLPAPRARPFVTAGAAVILLYPAGHAVGLVDTYPAHNLYSDYAPASLTCLPPVATARALEWRAHVWPSTQLVDGQAWDCVNEVGWYLDTLHVPPYSAPRVQAALAVAACDRLQPPDIVLRERDLPSLFRPGAQPSQTWNREYRGCDAVRQHASSGLLGGTPR